MQLKMQLNGVDSGENVITHCDIFFFFFIRRRLLIITISLVSRAIIVTQIRDLSSSSRAHDSVN